MQIRIPAREIDKAWPDGLADLFRAHGVKVADTSAPHAPESIRFVEPCRCRWDGVTGDLVVDQS